MSTIKALLLVGSPRGERSTSNAICAYLSKGLVYAGAEADTVCVGPMAKSAEGLARLETSVSDADVLIIASPLYIDSIPAFMLRALEHIRDARKAAPPRKKQALFAIVNSGFPEPYQNDAALEIYRLFARESGMDWAGGIRIGWGGAIDGRPLESTGGMTRSLREGLDLAAAALAKGEPVPENAIALASKPFMPLFLARLMMVYYGKHMWNGQVKDKGILAKMRDRPYQGEKIQ